MKSEPKTLFVFYNAVPVGQVTENADGILSFQYDRSWLTSGAGFAISQSLPLRPQVFSGGAAHAYFANLLPEGRLRSHLAQTLSISEGDDFIFLRELGQEIAGALRILTSPTPDTPKQAPSSRRPIDAEALKLFYLQSSVASVYNDRRRHLRLSLAGAQQKLPVLFDPSGGGLWTTDGSEPSTHILKITNRDYKALPENEYYLNMTARLVGLPVPAAFLIPVPPVSLTSNKRPFRFLVIERYDRIREGSSVKRLHQEDLCQALGILPSKKYEKEGGPSLLDAFRMTETIANNPVIDLDRLVEWTVFNLVCGNADAHGKNLSFLYRENSAELSPFYDLVSTRAYPSLDRAMAMTIGGRSDPGQIGRNDWQSLARNTRVTAPYLLKKVKSTSERIEEAADQAYKEFAHEVGRIELINQIRLEIHRQARRTRELL